MTSAMSIAVDACSEPWIGPAGGPFTCGGVETSVLADTPVASAGTPIALPDLDEGASWYGRFIGTFAASAGDEHQGSTGSVLATFTAAGEQGEVCSTPTTTTTTTTAPGSGTPTTDPGAGGTGPGSGGPGPGDPPQGAGPSAPWSLPLTGGDVLPLVVIGFGLVAVGLPLRRRGTAPKEPAPTIEG
jgi:hypothetical protein